MLTVINFLKNSFNLIPAMFFEHGRYQKSVPIWALVSFRLAFGLMMMLSVVRFWAKGWIEDLYIKPQFFFTFYGFEWVKPLGDVGMYGLFALTFLAALGIFLGLFFRISAILFFLSFTYIELIDKTTYLNHYYFVSLMSFLLIFLPANRNFSLDVFFNKKIILTEISLWQIGILRLQMGILYFFAGVAKLNSDWLFLAQPLKIWLRPHANMPIIGDFFKYEMTAYIFSWSGAIYDLFIPFILLYARTRIYGYIAVILFHSLTSLLFPIGLFPYIMIICTSVFFSGREHGIFYKKIKKWSLFADFFSQKTAHTIYENGKKQNIVLNSFLMVYFLIQVFLPMRYVFYPSQLFWSEEGFRFSWRVMLVEKAGYARFFVKSEQSNAKFEIDEERYLTAFQRKMMCTQPDMILQYAHFLKDKQIERGIINPEIYAEVYSTLNGRSSELLINPDVDLAKEKDSFLPQKWILKRNDY